MQPRRRLLMLLGFLAVPILAAGLLAYHGWPLRGTGPGRQAGLLPREVEGLPLVQLVTGSAALAAINQLHGVAIDLVDGYVAAYARGSERVYVWLSRAASAQEARQLVSIMTRKMQGSDVFTPPEPFELEGRTFYFTAGAGMRNYYWAVGRDVYWVGIISPNEGKILHAFVRR